MTSSNALKSIVTAARPLLEQLIDVTEQVAALRDTATHSGVDWSQMKALLKAQILDERDGKDRVAKLVEKAEFACAYAGMLGFGAKVNDYKNNTDAPHDAETGELEPASREEVKATATRYRMEDTARLSQEAAALGLVSPESVEETKRIAQAINDKYGDGKPLDTDLTPPAFLQRRRSA